MSSVLITGGAGFIGCALAGRLVGEGHDVTVADSLHPQVHPTRGRPDRLPAGAGLVPLDVTSGAGWDALLELFSPEVVVHLAAETGTGQSLAQATRHGSVNVVGTTEMLDALLRAGAIPAHVVLASSRAVYGEGRWLADDGIVFYPGWRNHESLVEGRWDPVSPSGVPARPLPQEVGATEPRPTSVHAATKLAQEHLCGAWAAAKGAALSVLRLQNVYGPGQSLDNRHTGVLTLFARLALQGEVLDVYEDGRIIRDFVYVEDAVDAFVAAIASPPTTTRTVDIGSGTPATMADVARLIAASAGAPEPVASGKFRDGDVRAAWCTLGEAQRQLGYQPSTSLEEGLAELLVFAKAGG